METQLRKRKSKRHATASNLESYALGRLDDRTGVEGFEEHLLVCQVCRSRVTRWDHYIAALRGALRRFSGEAAGIQTLTAGG